jgi:hypothetical protein
LARVDDKEFHHDRLARQSRAEEFRDDMDHLAHQSQAEEWNLFERENSGPLRAPPEPSAPSEPKPPDQLDLDL